jgi:flavorubredoxin
MPVRELKKGIYNVGAIDWDRTTFDALVPLPYGTSYNAYLVKGRDKVTLIDTVEPAKSEILKKNLEDLGIDHLDYIISNHAEQDHSGSIPEMLALFPGSKLIVNKKGRDMLLPLMDIPDDRIELIEDRDTLQLGEKTLEFIFAPWVHWPETMFSYLREERILFSCDLFGSHLASSELWASQNDNAIQEAKRYYAEIMMPYAGKIPRHLDNLQDFEIDVIAPSHGPAYDHPPLIMNAYREWLSEKVENRVVLLYISMHGSTEKLVQELSDGLMRRNIAVKPFNLLTASIADIALEIVDAATVILASPAVLMGAHPNMVYAAAFLNGLKPKTNFIGIVGSYGWAHKMTDQLNALLKDLKAEILPPLLIRGIPKPENGEEIDKFAEQIYRKHQTIMSSE